MEQEQEDKDARRRLAGIASVALMAVACSLAFGRVFVGTDPSLKLVATVMLSLGVAVGLRRLHVLLAIPVATVLLILALGPLVFTETTRYGLITASTLREMTHAIGLVGLQARTEIAPTPPLTPLMLAAVAAVWAASFSAHALAVRAGSPLLAMLPLLALVAFADSVMHDGARPIYGALCLAGALAIIASDGLRRVRRWGPLKWWSGYSRRRLGTIAKAQGARRAVITVVGIAVLLPGLLPGYGASPLVHAHAQPTRTSGPTVSLAASLPPRPAVALLRVQTTQPQYLRVTSLDHFDGVAWSLTSDPAVGIGVLGTLPPPPSQFAAPGTLTAQEQITLLASGSPWIALPYLPEAVTPLRSATYDAWNGSVRTAQPLPVGSSYVVTSKLVEPTPYELDGAPDPSSAAYRSGSPSSLYGRYTQLPGTLPLSVSQLARQLTASAPDEYRKMLAIQRYLHTFSYTQNVAVPPGQDPLTYFLEKSKRGFCQQFAGAMAVMARTLGYPSRVAVGYLPGEEIGRSNTWIVTTRDAHAWPEILFPGYGWIAFEPTPGKNNPVAGGYLAPGGLGPIGPNKGSPARGRGIGSGRKPGKGEIVAPATGRPPVTAPVAGRAGLRSIELALAIALFLGLVGLPLLKTLSRGRWRAKTPEATVLAAYAWFASRSADVGLGRRPGETAFEHAGRIRRDVSFSDGHLWRLMDLTAKAAYSSSRLEPADASAARLDARATIDEIKRSVPLSRRIRGLYRMSSGPSRSLRGFRGLRPRAPG